MKTNIYFKTKKPLIGLIHLPASVGYPSYPGKDAIFQKACKDLRALQQAGFDGALIENDKDQPHQIEVEPKIAQEFKEIVAMLKEQATIPIGIELLYDMRKTLEIAMALDLTFVRLDVFADAIRTKWGDIGSQSVMVKNLKKRFGSTCLVFTDVQVKHATMIHPKSIEESVTESINQGSNGIIVTGTLTGIPPTQEDCTLAKANSGNIPVYIGSGLTLENAEKLLPLVDGAFVGTSIKHGDNIDFDKALALKKLTMSIGGQI